jgi:hypothetical protein
LSYDNEIDMSDNAIGKASSYGWDMVPCKNGTYKPVNTKNGITKYKQLNERQISTLNSIAANDDEPCTCIICTKRKENALEATPVGSSRTRRGGGDAFTKHGVGRTLGGSS